MNAWKRLMAQFDAEFTPHPRASRIELAFGFIAGLLWWVVVALVVGWWARGAIVWTVGWTSRWHSGS